MFNGGQGRQNGSIIVHSLFRASNDFFFCFWQKKYETEWNTTYRLGELLRRFCRLFSCFVCEFTMRHRNDNKYNIYLLPGRLPHRGTHTNTNVVHADNFLFLSTNQRLSQITCFLSTRWKNIFFWQSIALAFTVYVYETTSTKQKREFRCYFSTFSRCVELWWCYMWFEWGIAVDATIS